MQRALCGAACGILLVVFLAKTAGLGRGGQLGGGWWPVDVAMPMHGGGNTDGGKKIGPQAHCN